MLASSLVGSLSRGEPAAPVRGRGMHHGARPTGRAHDSGRGLRHHLSEESRREAKSFAIDACLMEKCRESRLVAVTLSGTVMEDSHYQVDMIQKLVADLGGCIMCHWFGHT